MTGVVIDDVGVIRPAPGASMLERRATRDEVVRRLERAQAELAAADRRRQAAQTAPRLPSGRARLRARRSTRRGAHGGSPMRPTARRLGGRECRSGAGLAGSPAGASSARPGGRRGGRAARAELGTSTTARPAMPPAPRRTARSRLSRRAWPTLRAERDRGRGCAGEAEPRVTRARRTAAAPRSAWASPRPASEELDREELALSGREADLVAERERLAGELAAAAGEAAAGGAGVRGLGGLRPRRTQRSAGGGGRGERGTRAAAPWPRVAAGRARSPRWRRGCSSMPHARACSWSWPPSARTACASLLAQSEQTATARGARQRGAAGAARGRPRRRPRGLAQARPSDAPSQPRATWRGRASRPCAAASTTSAPAIPSPCRSWPSCRSDWSRWRRSARTSRRPSARHAS